MQTRLGLATPIKEIPPELGACLAGAVPGRENERERIMLITGGIGINDIAVARSIYERALDMGKGVVLEA